MRELMPASPGPPSKTELLRRWFSRRLQKPKEWLCGAFRGHDMCGDTGWLVGSKFRDRHCSKCGKRFSIPLVED